MQRTIGHIRLGERLSRRRSTRGAPPAWIRDCEDEVRDHLYGAPRQPAIVEVGGARRDAPPGD